MEVLRRGPASFPHRLDHGGRALPQIPRAQRLAWFYGFTLVCLVAKLGLVFMAPMYYLLILTGGVRDRIAALGLACGAVAGPLAYLILRKRD